MTMIPSTYYRERAAECASSASAATLDNVRRQSLASEAAWLELAGRALEHEGRRAAAAAGKAAEL